MMRDFLRPACLVVPSLALPLLVGALWICPAPVLAQEGDSGTTPTAFSQITMGGEFSWGGVRRVARSVWRYDVFKVRDHSVELNQIVLAVLVLFGGVYLMRRLSGAVGSYLASHSRFDRNRAQVLERILFYTLVVIVALFALQIGGIPITIFAFLGGAIAIGIGFGAQNIFNNFISGLILMFEQPVRIGDLIEVDGDLGQVAVIGGRCTRIRRSDGIEMLVPNSKLLENTVVNRTLTDRLIRTSVVVGVAYGSPTRQVAEIIENAAREHPDILGAPPPAVIFDDFGDSALIFEVYFWADVRSMMQLRKICSDLRFAIDDQFREAGITIAFPQRDVHLDGLGPLDVRVVSPANAPPPDPES